jgi:tetratricopeptide (TPR) repeat protein
VNSIILGMALFLFVACGAAAQPNGQGVGNALQPVSDTAGAPAVSELTIRPKEGAAPTATVAPSATSTAAPTLAELIDAAWAAGDWPQVIALLKRADPVDANKLYSAYFNYGQVLLAKGDKAGAAVQFQSAVDINTSGPEARQAILALTPSPTPTRTAGTLAANRYGHSSNRYPSDGARQQRDPDRCGVQGRHIE